MARSLLTGIDDGASINVCVTGPGSATVKCRSTGRGRALGRVQRTGDPTCVRVPWETAFDAACHAGCLAPESGGMANQLGRGDNLVAKSLPARSSSPDVWEKLPPFPVTLAMGGRGCWQLVRLFAFQQEPYSGNGSGNSLSNKCGHRSRERQERGHQEPCSGNRCGEDRSNTGCIAPRNTNPRL